MNTTSRPILFSAPMVRAILDGSKTQTRRIIKPQPEQHRWDHPSSNPPFHEGLAFVGKNVCAPGYLTVGVDRAMETPGFLRALHKPGDELWVKETWRTIKAGDTLKPIQLHEIAPIFYEADDPGPSSRIHAGRIRQSIFMRQWMSRITLQISDVRIQRIQDISDYDAIAEGITPMPHDGKPYWLNYTPKHEIAAFTDPVESYRSLWDQINGPTAWDRNPFVAAYTFTRSKP